MFPIVYYFRNSYKRNGYRSGRLNRPLYDKWIEKLSKDAGKDGDLFLKNLINNKDSDLFLKKLVDSEMEEQAKIVRDRATNLKIESDNADKELKRIKSLEAEEKAKIDEKFNSEKKTLIQERLKIEQDFADYSLLESKQLKGEKETLGKLLDFLGNSVEEIKACVVEQSEKLKLQRKSALKNNTKLTTQEIKENIIQKEKINESSNKKTDEKLGNSLGHLIFLTLMCVFDIILGYGVASDMVEMHDKILFLPANLAAAFLALLVIPLVIYILHSSVKGMGGPENKNMRKQLGIFSVVFTVFIVILYILQSDPVLLSSIFGKTLGNTLRTKPEILFRAFLLPSLFAGEIVIGLIDWDLILDYFGIGKRKGPNSLSKLITNGLYFLKSRRISSYAKEEKKAIDNLINEMKKEGVPTFTEIKDGIREVQSVLDPIWDKQTEKQEEFKEKMDKIDKELKKNSKDHDTEIQEITNKYAPEIKRLENIKDVNNYKIDRLNYNFNKHSNDTKEGIKIGLFNH